LSPVMNNIVDLLNSIPKDDHGFHDINKFWEITGMLGSLDTTVIMLCY